MSTKHDPYKILHYLAECLDVRLTLETFPKMTRENLREIIIRAADCYERTSDSALLWVDGAARGNPGPAGAGIILRPKGTQVFAVGEYLGKATNNEAEYRALLLGMEAAASRGCEELEVLSDSELMVRQLKGEYRVKNPRLQDLYFRAVKGMAPFKRITFTHIRREENKEADRLANMAIDSKGKVSL
jgi:ribonuclease HI